MPSIYGYSRNKPIDYVIYGKIMFASGARLRSQKVYSPLFPAGKCVSAIKIRNRIARMVSSFVHPPGFRENSSSVKLKYNVNDVLAC